MSKFIIIPRYRSSENINVQYDAPCMIIDAQDQSHAVEIAESSALSRFDEWEFHVATFFEKKRHSGIAPELKADPNSKSQKGKKITGHSDSRPLRRALDRLKMKKNNQSGSHHKGGSMQCWS